MTDKKQKQVFQWVYVLFLKGKWLFINKAIL